MKTSKWLVTGMVLLTTAAASAQNEPQVSRFKRVAGAAQGNMVPCPAAGYSCYPQSIAVGPNANGSTLGTAWVLGTGKTSAGDYYVYRRQGSKWVRTDGAGLQIAVGVDGYPWAITHLGTIYYWNGSTFVLAPGGGCATSIGVGPTQDPGAFPYGWPLIIGCDGSATTDGSIYQFDGSGWVLQPGAANRISVTTDGTAWVITSAGSVFYSSFAGYLPGPAGCASSIAAGKAGFDINTDVWITGCGDVNNRGAKIFQLSPDFSWLPISGIASQVAVSPDLGVAWVVTLTGEIFVYE
jgi:hypothetical protein